MLYHEDSNSEAQHLPSAVLAKALVHKNLGCETLSGVIDKIDAIVSVSSDIPIVMADLSDSEIYAAYRLYTESGEFGAKNPPSEKLNDLMAERALNDWLKNFKPDKWTYKVKRSEIFEEETVEKVTVNELDIPMLQMTEMLASLMTRLNLKTDIDNKLYPAFNTLM